MLLTSSNILLTRDYALCEPKATTNENVQEFEMEVSC